MSFTEAFARLRICLVRTCFVRTVFTPLLLTMLSVNMLPYLLLTNSSFTLPLSESQGINSNLAQIRQNSDEKI